MNIIELYKAQLRVLWKWQGGPLALIWALRADHRRLGDRIPRRRPGSCRASTVDGFAAAIVAVILMTLFNAVIRSVLLALVAPFSLILTGVLVLVLQIVAFLVVAQWVPGVTVDGFGSALVGSFVYAIIDTILTSILGVDRGGTYYAHLIRALLVNMPRRTPTSRAW